MKKYRLAESIIHFQEGVIAHGKMVVLVEYAEYKKLEETCSRLRETCNQFETGKGEEVLKKELKAYRTLADKLGETLENIKNENFPQLALYRSHKTHMIYMAREALDILFSFRRERGDIK